MMARTLSSFRRWSMRLGVFFLLVGAASAPVQVSFAQNLAVRSASDLPAMAFYQLDGRAFWRLSDSVVTLEGGAPLLPRPVYIQFGSVSCAPCRDLAGWIDERLSSQVVRVYAHIDEVELAENAMPLGQLRRELAQQMATDEHYATFLTLVSVPLGLVQQLTGTVSLPGGVLILPDGRHMAFSGLELTNLEHVVGWFEQELAIYE